MRVNVSHLVLEPLGNANDEIVYDRPYSAQRCDILARTVVKFDVDDVLFRVREGDGKMAKVFRELACEFS
jgi:hypothetical protein